MDHFKFLILLTILVFIYRPDHVNAATYDSPNSRVFVKDSAGNWKTLNGNGSIQSGNGGSNVTIQNRPSLPTTKGNQYMDISRTGLVDLAKVGGALASLAKKLGPLGMAGATAAYICTETNICDVAGEWLFNDTSGVFIVDGVNPTCENAASWPSTTTYTGLQIHNSFPTTLVEASLWCPLDHPGEQQPADWGVITPCQTICFQGNLLQKVTPGGMPDGNPPQGEQRAVTDADWDNAASQLNNPSSTDHIIDNGGGVPIDNSSPPTIDGAPLNSIISSETKTITDSSGNSIGSEVTETSIQITDGATPDNPNAINFIEKTTVTNYDINNNITNQTTTETSTAPPAPPDTPDVDYEIDFDDVSDNDLDEFEFPDIFTYESWGEGSCPADRSVSYGYGALNLSMQPACDFAQGVRPIILIIAGLSAMFIISGIKTE